MKTCVFCKTRYQTGSGITFHKFPTDSLKQLWLKNMNIDNWNLKANSVLCSKHFTEDCFIKHGARTTLKSGSVPTFFNGSTSPAGCDSIVTPAPYATVAVIRKLSVNQNNANLDNPSTSGTQKKSRTVHEVCERMEYEHYHEKMQSKTTSEICEIIRHDHCYENTPETSKKVLQRVINALKKSRTRVKVLSQRFKRLKTKTVKGLKSSVSVLVDDLSDSSLISDPEETSGAPEPSAPDVGLRRLSVDFLCKTCSKNITSFRYRCLVCPDYDMCGECERRGGHHDDHYVLRVPVQRPTLEVDQVESAVRRALSSSTTWSKAFKSTVKSEDAKGNQSKKIENKPDETRNSGDSRTDTGNDSDTEDALSDIETKPEITLHELGTTEPDVGSSVDEPVVKVELVIKEEEDPLEEEAAASAFLQNIHERQTTRRSNDVPSDCPIPAFQCVPSSHIVLPTEGVQLSQGVPPSHITQASQGGPWSYIVPLIHGAPQSQSVPTSKRRRGDEHRFTTTTHSHKITPTSNETTGTDPSSSSTVATSSESGSKVDVFVLKKKTRTADENYD